MPTTPPLPPLPLPEPEPEEWAIQLAAQAWCEPETSSVVMDERLAFVFARMLTREADRRSRAQIVGYVGSNGEIIASTPYQGEALKQGNAVYVLAATVATPTEPEDDPEMLVLAQQALDAMATRTPEEATRGAADWIMGPGGSEGTTSIPSTEPAARARGDVEVDGWRPIATAPSTGTILLWWKNAGAVTGGFAIDDDWKRGSSTPREGWKGDGDERIPRNQEDCTHWQLLRAPAGNPWPRFDGQHCMQEWLESRYTAPTIPQPAATPGHADTRCQHPSWEKAGNGKERCAVCGLIGEERRFFQPVEAAAGGVATAGFDPIRAALLVMIHEAQRFNAATMQAAGVGPFDLVAIRQAEAALSHPQPAATAGKAEGEAVQDTCARCGRDLLHMPDVGNYCCCPKATPIAAPAGEADTRRLDWIERYVCDVSRLGDSAHTLRISWNNGADYAFVGPRYNATWREAIDAAIAASGTTGEVSHG